jgi:hypothetical protein
MSNRYFELRDVQRDAVRTACAAIELALVRLPATEAPELRSRWAELVALLAVEPARVLRECPVCQQVAMFEATRRFNCWTKLPVANADDALAVVESLATQLPRPNPPI